MKHYTGLRKIMFAALLMTAAVIIPVFADDEAPADTDPYTETGTIFVPSETGETEVITDHVYVTDPEDPGIDMTAADRERMDRAVTQCGEILSRLGVPADRRFLGTLNAGHPGGMLPLTAAEKDSLHHMGSLATDTRKFLQQLVVVGNFAAIAFGNYFCCFKQMLGLGIWICHRLNIRQNLLLACLAHGQCIGESLE